MVNKLSEEKDEIISYLGRTEKVVDWNKVDQLLLADCMGTEIAPHFDMHVKTFYKKVVDKFGVTFTEYSALKKVQGDSLLKAKQFEKAIKGDNTMLVWLGKNRLGQKENHDVPHLAPNQEKIDQSVIILDQQAEIAQNKQEILLLKEKLGEAI